MFPSCFWFLPFSLSLAWFICGGPSSVGPFSDPMRYSRRREARTFFWEASWQDGPGFHHQPKGKHAQGQEKDARVDLEPRLANRPSEAINRRPGQSECPSQPIYEFRPPKYL